jgi:hypothetical protein
LSRHQKQMLKRARKSRISALINYFTNKSTRDVYQKPLDKILDLISEVTAEAKLSKTQVDGIIFAWKPSDAVTLRAFIDLYIENTVKNLRRNSLRSRHSHSRSHASRFPLTKL